MDYNRAQTVDFYFGEIDAGRGNLASMRKEMVAAGHAPDEISIVFRLVDRMLQQSADKKASRVIGRNLFWGGILMTAAGVLMIVFVFGGVLLVGKGIKYGATFAPTVFGLFAVAAGWAKMNR